MRLRYLVMPTLALVLTTALSLSFSEQSKALSLNVAGLHDGASFGLSDDEKKFLDYTLGLKGDLQGEYQLASAMAHRIPQPKDEIIKINPGDALGVVMERAGIGNTESNQAIKAMKKHFDPRHLKAGQDVHMHFIPANGNDYKFMSMKIEMDPIKTVVVKRGEEGFNAELHEKPVERRIHARKAKVQNSLYGSAAKAGIPEAVVAEAIRIYSWSIDFQRDIRQGDTLEVMYDNFETDDGYIAKNGKILYANLTIGGKEIPLYRYKMKDGRVDYFEPNGMSIKKTLMRTPVDGARISSGYGMRRHPVLGYNKMHKGVDFAAPTGTPIYAAGDGVVERANRFSSYGKYIRIRHNGGLKTAYAHLHKIKVRAGQRVKQGQVIGTVGSTGRSTGPHLHYEVLVNGKQVNPRSVKLPIGEKLRGKQLQAFKATMRDMNREFTALTQSVKYASRPVTSHASNKRYN